MEQEFYTVKEVADKLKITRKGVYDLMRDGRLRYVQIGIRQRRITAAALRDFVQSREIDLSDYNTRDMQSPSLIAA